MIHVRSHVQRLHNVVDNFRNVDAVVVGGAVVGGGFADGALNGLIENSCCWIQYASFYHCWL